MGQNDIQLGRVVCVSGSHIVMVWEPPTDGRCAGTAGRLQKGALVKLETPTMVVYGLVAGLTIPNPTRGSGADEAWLAELELIGESDPDGGNFRPGVSSFPTLGDPVWAANELDLSKIYGEPNTSSLTLGTLQGEKSGAVHVEPDLLLGRHFAILGTTGSGKSCALTLILRALLEKHEDAHIVLLDPHNEYHTAFGDRAELLGPERLRLPYWVLNSEEVDMVMFGPASGVPDRSITSEILHELIADAKNQYQSDRQSGRPVTVNTPIPYRLSDVLRSIDEVMGKVDKPSSLMPYKWLKNRLNALTTDPRFAFMFGGIAVSDNFAAILSQILRIPGDGRPISIIDLSSVPSEVMNAVVSVLLRLTFDFSLWSRGARPILLVCEEAHRYAPQDNNLGFEPTKNALARIAKEGRKYGLSLCLVSQRPSELATSVLSQCNTTFVFRITSQRDQQIIRGTVLDSSSGLLDFLPLLGNGEAVVIGDAVSMPVRISFGRLPEDQRPQSMTARFSEAWRAAPVGDSLVHDAVQRWRMHQR